ncbi:MAG: hypothetical protein H7Y89_04035 [Steroidobacteraceae bacterium]|nr:hypothetical protein [Steroidobacteraceae bacterium]
MRRLTLILSDLYLPEEEAHDVIPLPNLEWLLRFSIARQRIPDWRTWLASELGYKTGSVISFAGFAGPRGAWFATPVHLLAALDHVRMDARGLLTLGAEEREAWCAAFARTFGPQYVLHDDGLRGFFLTGLGPADVRTTDPARLLGADIATALPRGASAGELRRLSTEIEMWLHSEPLNVARTQRGRRPVSALWLWGGGGAHGIDAAERPARDIAFIGGDPFLAALARDAGRPMRPVSQDGSELGDRGALPVHVVVVLAPMSGEPRMSLADADRIWLGGARRVLERGARVDIVANDWVVRIEGRASWRFWRRRVPWAAGLADSPRDVRA